MFWNQNRIGNPVNPANQSLSGAAARLAGSLDTARGWWLAAEIVTALAGLAAAARAHRRGQSLAGLVCCAVTGLLISPIAWTHHWVWAVPLLIRLSVCTLHRRSFWCAVATVTIATVFSGLIPMPWPGHPLSPGRLAEGDLYVLAPLGVLACTAAAVTWDRSRDARRSSQSSSRRLGGGIGCIALPRPPPLKPHPGAARASVASARHVWLGTLLPRTYAHLNDDQWASRRSAAPG